MPGFGNIGGVWRTLKPLKTNIGGVWKNIRQAFGNIGGVQKPIFTDTLTYSNFLDTSVFTASRSLNISGRDTPTDKDKSYVLRAEASRLYVYYKIRSDSTSGGISIKTVNPIDFTNYSKVTLASAHCAYLNTDYRDPDDGPMSCFHEITVTIGILAAGSSTYTKSITQRTTANNVVLDVSDIKGSYYLPNLPRVVKT